MPRKLPASSMRACSADTRVSMASGSTAPIVSLLPTDRAPDAATLAREASRRASGRRSRSTSTAFARSSAPTIGSRRGELVFERELVRQKLGARAWFLGFWGIGTYKRNDEVDVRYELDGRPMVAHALEIISAVLTTSRRSPRLQQPQRREDRAGRR